MATNNSSSSFSPPPPSMAITNPERSSPPAKKARKKGESYELPPLTHYLPEDILNIAMTLLPLKEAARLSTVATRFSKTWCYNKIFVFGRELATRNDQRAMVALIDRLFDSHRGKEIQCFQVHVDPIEITDVIMRWLGICSKKRTEDVQLNFLRRGFLLSPDAIDCLSENLKSLTLVRCGITMPPVRKSMQFLHTVTLKQVQLISEQLESLVWHCRGLVNLELLQCYGLQTVRIYARAHRHLRMVKVSGCTDVDWMNIDSPTIKCFFFSGVQPTIHFGGVGEMELEEAICNFVLAKAREAYVQHYRVEALLNVMYRVNTLTISAHFLESLSTRIRLGWNFRGSSFSLLYLKELQLFIEASSYCSPYDIILFVNNCPHLERFFIDMQNFNFGAGMYWEVHQKPLLDEYLKIYSLKLRTVKIKGFKFERSELVVLKYLLQGSRDLENLILITQKNGTSKLSKQDASKWNNLFSSWRASPLLKIQLYQHSDKSGINPTHSKFWR